MPISATEVWVIAAAGEEWVAAWAVEWDKEEAAAGAAEEVGGEVGAKWCGSPLLPFRKAEAIMYQKFLVLLHWISKGAVKSVNASGFCST